jgi:hypothetical protein
MDRRIALILALLIVFGASSSFAQAPGATKAGTIEQQMEDALKLQENKARLVKPKIKIEVEDKRLK